MYPFYLINTVPPDVIMEIQLGAGRVFYFAVVLAAAAIAMTIAYEKMHDEHDSSRYNTTPKEADSHLRRAA